MNTMNRGRSLTSDCLEHTLSATIGPLVALVSAAI